MFMSAETQKPPFKTDHLIKYYKSYVNVCIYLKKKKNDIGFV